MKYLHNSPFGAIFRLEELWNGGLTQSNARLLPEETIILRLTDAEQERSATRGLEALAAQYALKGVYVLPESDRNLHLFRGLGLPGVQLAVYVPTDELLYDCMYFGRTFNFGAQIDLLRRCFILNAAPVVLYVPDALRDAAHYFEMVAQFTRQVLPMQFAPLHEEYKTAYSHLFA